MNIHKPKILITAPLDFLNDLREDIEKQCILYYKNQPSLNETIEIIDKFKPEGWLCNPCPPYKIDEEILKWTKSLRIIATPSTGTNHINIDSAQQKNIIVTSLKGSPIIDYIRASSEFTLTLLLSAIRKTKKAQHLVEEGFWRSKEEDLRSHEFSAINLGIIGCGRIGGNMTKYCTGLGMKVFVYDPFIEGIQREKINKLGAEFVSKLSLIPEHCNAVCICVHLNENTKNMINESFLLNMKPGSILINTSRGGVIDEDALIQALKGNIIGSVALDVLSDEDRIENFGHKIIELSKKDTRIIVTPHIAGLTYESERKAQGYSFETIIDFLKQNQ